MRVPIRLGSYSSFLFFFELVWLFFLSNPSIMLGYNFCIQPLGHDIKIRVLCFVDSGTVYIITAGYKQLGRNRLLSWFIS